MEAKIYEFHGNFGVCMVCARDKQHGKELIWFKYKEELSPIAFSKGQEIPKLLYDVMTMEQETEDETIMISFSQYMKERKEDQFEILTSLTA